MSQSTVHLTLAGSQKSQVILMPLTIIIIIILIVILMPLTIINIIVLMPLPHQNRFPTKTQDVEFEGKVQNQHI